MKYALVLTGKFKKGLKLAKKRGLNISLLESIVERLLHKIPLDAKNKDHALIGNYKGYRECHIQPDWLLIYLIEEDILTLTLIDTGTHADLLSVFNTMFLGLNIETINTSEIFGLAGGVSHMFVSNEGKRFIMICLI